MPDVAVACMSRVPVPVRDAPAEAVITVFVVATVAVLEAEVQVPSFASA